MGQGEPWYLHFQQAPPGAADADLALVSKHLGWNQTERWEKIGKRETWATGEAEQADLCWAGYGERRDPRTQRS